VQQRAYHFAYFRITSEADFNALFIPGGHSGSFMMSNAANAYITAHRGFPSFLFAGEEDPVQDQLILIPRFVTDKNDLNCRALGLKVAGAAVVDWPTDLWNSRPGAQLRIGGSGLIARPSCEADANQKN
jgi:hypothetical protein